MSKVRPDSSTTNQLLDRVRRGERAAYEQLFQRHRAYLRRIIRMRLDPRLRCRVDPSDIVQETQIEVFRRLDDFLRREPMPFHLWLRKTAQERLTMAHRFHLHSDRRSVCREALLPAGSSLRLAASVLISQSTPIDDYDRRELSRIAQAIMNAMPDQYREVLMMRILEQMSNQEVAQVLEIEPATASQRYGRALLRLRELLRERGLTDADDS